MKFDATHYPYPSNRNVVFAKNGMVCAGNPSAAEAGLSVLRKGGNAIDAAIAVAASMPVVEPTGNGLGSDCFAIIWYQGKMYGINGSGPSPRGVSIEALQERGYQQIPYYGIESINTPGAVEAWMEIHRAFGKLSLEEDFAPAIEYAREGYPLSPTVAKLWQKDYLLYSKFREKKEFQGWFDTFGLKGRGPYPGEIFHCEDMAKTLESIVQTEGKSFYQGEIAEKIDDFMKEYKGFLTKEDLAKYRPRWVDPISICYRGVDVWEIPPNGQGITVLMALNILKEFEFTSRDSVKTLHRQIEAMKLSMSDTAKYVTDPNDMRYSTEELLSEEYARSRCREIGKMALEPRAGQPGSHSTVYFCTADREGNMVSMIQSNFRGFGSGIVIPGTGISLNDRMENFKMDPTHDNGLKGGKLPYHTIIPGFLTKGEKALGPFGIMGGFMQPQAHVQVIMNMVDFGLNPQAALDAPRFQWIGGKTVEVEQEVPNHIIRQLQEMGHDIVVQPDSDNMGRGQIILRNDEGVFCSATEKRTDGQIAAF